MHVCSVCIAPGRLSSPAYTCVGDCLLSAGEAAHGAGSVDLTRAVDSLGNVENSHVFSCASGGHCAASAVQSSSESPAVTNAVNVSVDLHPHSGAACYVTEYVGLWMLTLVCRCVCGRPVRRPECERISCQWRGWQAQCDGGHWQRRSGSGRSASYKHPASFKLPLACQ